MFRIELHLHRRFLIRRVIHSRISHDLTHDICDVHLRGIFSRTIGALHCHGLCQSRAGMYIHACMCLRREILLSGIGIRSGLCLFLVRPCSCTGNCLFLGAGICHLSLRIRLFRSNVFRCICPGLCLCCYGCCLRLLCHITDSIRRIGVNPLHICGICFTGICCLDCLHQICIHVRLSGILQKLRQFLRRDSQFLQKIFGQCSHRLHHIHKRFITEKCAHVFGSG